jgi:hypothetical protein
MELAVAVGVMGLFCVVGVYYFLVRRAKNETQQQQQ